jgi:hypothetical protein
MRARPRVCCLGVALMAAACSSSAPSPPAREPLKELWRGHTTGDEYWVQIVANEEMTIKGPQGASGFGVVDGYQWEIGWGETGGLAIEGRRLRLNGRLHGGLLKRGDRIRVNASSGEVTVNDLGWD